MDPLFIKTRPFPSDLTPTSEQPTLRPTAPLEPLQSVGLPSVPSEVLKYLAGNVPRVESEGAPKLIPTLAVLRYSSSGDLVVAYNEKLDPALYGWLKIHCTKACAIADCGERLTYLVNAVARTMRSDPLLHPIRARRFQALEQREQESGVLLGDFIENRTGVCRHHATLLQLACQMCWLPSFPSIGNRAEIDEKTLKTGRPLRHMWLIVSVGNEVRLADVSLNQTIKIDAWGKPCDRNELIRLYGSDHRSLRVWTKQSWNMRSCYRYQSQDSASSFIRDLRHEPATTMISEALLKTTQRPR